MSDALTETELWLLRHGLPSFTRRRVGSSARRVGTMLIVVAAFEAAAVAPSQRWPWWLDLIVLVLAPAAVALVVARTFDATSRRSSASLGRRIADLAFVAVPTALALALASPGAAALVAAANLAVLAGVVLDQRFGVFAVVGWCVRHGLGQVKTALARLSRSVPLLAVVVLALFYTSEVWQAAAGLRIANLVAVVALLASAGILFAVSQVRSGLATHATDPDRAPLASDNPACVLASNPEPPPLSRVERGNVTVLLVVSQLCVVTATSAAFAALIVALGAVAIPVDVLAAWLGGPPSSLVAIEFLVQIHVTVELLALGAIMAGIAGLVFAVSLAGDQDFQDASRDRLENELATALEVRARYLAAVTGPASERATQHDTDNTSH